MDPRIIDLYNDYVHSTLPRREFLARLARLTGSAAAAAAVLPLIEPNYAHARQVDEADARLATGYVKYPGLSGDVRAYRARPKGTGKLPAVLVIHENRGLNAHIEDVARRAALAGYLAIAPDGLTSAGGAPADQEQARDLFAKTDPAQIAGDILAAVPWLATHAESSGKARRRGFLLRRRHGVALRRRAARRHGGRVLLRPAAVRGRDRETQGSRAPALRGQATIASMRASRTSARLSMRTACPTASTCIRARSTAFTTIRARRATTRRPRVLRGSARSNSSGRT